MDYESVERIFKTLPIGYYLGHKIDARLDPGTHSYYDPMEYCIVIGFGMLPVKGLDETDPHAEEIVRSVLYHEISHAILTPRTMRVTDIINIFEDQRIETLLKSFYMGVDFQKNVRIINNHTAPEIPTSPKQFFYNIVRYGEGPQEFVKKVYEIIQKHSALNAATESWGAIRDYIDDVNEFWREVCNYFNATMANEQNNSAQNDPSASNGENTGNDTENNGTSASTENKTSEDEGKNEGEPTGSASLTDRMPPEQLDAIMTKLNEEVRETLAATIDNVLHQYECTELAGMISRLVEASIKKQGRTAGASQGYSGKLDPKLIHRAGRPENYKWWEKENPHGQFARFTGLRVNLFCDVSGSFTESQTKLNEIIKALSMVERRLPNFTLNIVKCGENTTIAGKNEREIVCSGGNALGREIFDIYKRLQDPTAMTYNLVVFDGESQYLLAKHADHKRAWAAFNHPNCYIISDIDNEDRIKKLCKKANYTIVTRDYAELFEKKVVAALKRMFR